MANGTLNLQISSIAYQDTETSNNPQLRAWDVTYKLMGQCISKPKSENFTIQPNSDITVFDGSRVTSIDGTTQFDVLKPNSSENKYRFKHVSGTSPEFRTARAIGIDNTSQFSISTNGPLMVLTNTGGAALATGSIQIGDILRLDSGVGCSNANAGTFTIIAKTSNSITVNNTNASSQSFTVLDSDKFSIYSNGSNNQIQIGDKVTISGGFSQASYGTYEIVDVSYNFFDVLYAGTGGLPLESGITPNTGVKFYSSSKKFIMVACQDRCAVKCNEDTSDNSIVEPVEANNPQRPGVFLKNGSVYKLVVKNLTIYPVTISVVSAE